MPSREPPPARRPDGAPDAILPSPSSWAGKRLLHVVTGHALGGTEKGCLTVALGAKQGFGVENTILALSMSNGPMRRPFAEVTDGRVFHLKSGGGRIRQFAALLRFLRERLPEAVICHLFGVSHVLVGLAAAFVGVPVICAAGNPAPSRGNRRGRMVWSGILWVSRLLRIPVISASRYIESSLEELVPALPRGSRVIHNGCDAARIASEADAARRRRPGNGPLVVGMIARLDPIKDQPTLLKAWALLRKHSTFDSAELWIVGEGREAATLQHLATSLAIGDRVRFLGARGDVSALLGQMDAFVLSTTPAEGFGIVLIEALAAGVPIVASDVPACREVLGDGELGRLVPAGDALSLAEALHELLGSPAGVSSCAKAGREAVAAQYGLDNMAKSFLDAAFGTRERDSNSVAEGSRG